MGSGAETKHYPAEVPHNLAASDRPTLSGMGDGNLFVFLLGLAVSGLVVGALGRLAVPGPNPIGCLGTIAAGVAGSLLAGLVGRLIFGDDYAPGWIASVLGAALVVYLFSRFDRRRGVPYDPSRRR